MEMKRNLLVNTFVIRFFMNLLHLTVDNNEFKETVNWHKFSILHLFIKHLFTLSDPGHLWVGVDDWWNTVVVYVNRATLYSFNTQNSLIFCLVSEHWSFNDVTNSINTARASSVYIISDWILINTATNIYQYFDTSHNQNFLSIIFIFRKILNNILVLLSKLSLKSCITNIRLLVM